MGSLLPAKAEMLQVAMQAQWPGWLRGRPGGKGTHLGRVLRGKLRGKEPVSLPLITSSRQSILSSISSQRWGPERSRTPKNHSCAGL